MTLFPEMPVPRLFPEQAGAPGLLDLSSGVVPGLDNALLDSLRNYKVGGEGVDEIAPTMQLTLPVPEWGYYSWFIKGTTPSIPAGSSTVVDFYNVPDDIRMWVDSAYFIIASGDNRVNQFSLSAPVGYYSGADPQIVMADMSTPAIYMMWPDVRGAQTFDYFAGGPVLMEPGSKLQVKPSGAGVGASTITYHVLARATKLIRDRTP